MLMRDIPRPPDADVIKITERLGAPLNAKSERPSATKVMVHIIYNNRNMDFFDIPLSVRAECLSSLFQRSKVAIASLTFFPLRIRA